MLHAVRQRAQVNGQDAVRPAQAAEDHGEVEQRHIVGDHRGDGRAGDLQPLREDDEHQQRIEGDVQDAAEAQAEGGVFCVTLAAQHVRQDDVQTARDAADDGRPHSIVAGIADRVVARAHHAQQRLHENVAGEAVEQREQRRAGQGDRADRPGLAQLAPAQQPGDERAAADAPERGQRVDEKEHRERQRGRRDLVGVLRHADEEGIGEVVDHGDELACDRRQREGQQRLRHRHIFKEFAVLDALRHVLTSFQDDFSKFYIKPFS